MRMTVCAAALLATALPAAAQDQYIGGRYRLWQGNLSGEIRADDRGITGTDIELDEEFDLDSDVALNNIGVWAGIPWLGRVVVDYWFGDFEGEETLTRSITFAGQTFTVGETVEAQLSWRVLTVMLEYSLRLPLSGKTVGLRVGARAGGKLVFIEAEAESVLAGKHEAELRGGTPVVGGTAEIYVLEYFSIAVEVDGLKLVGFGTGFSGHVIDYSISVRGGIAGFFVGVGYRNFEIFVQDDRTNVDEAESKVRLGGFFVEAGFRF